MLCFGFWWDGRLEQRRRCWGCCTAGLIPQHSSELRAPDWRVMTTSFGAEGFNGQRQPCKLSSHPISSHIHSCLPVIDDYIFDNLFFDNLFFDDYIFFNVRC